MVADNDGILVIAATNVDSEIQEMLNDLYLKYKTKEYTIRQLTKF